MPVLDTVYPVEGEGAPPWRELCVVCTHPVYLAQRLRVQGNLYHRTCFRCARCSAQLTLVDYYETHDGKFCCETCPDEVAIDKTANSIKAVSHTEVDAVLPPSPPPEPLRPPLTPTLSPTTRQSIVAMRRMFFDTDDAKLTRCETLRTDLPPADIPISPNDKVKPQIVHSPVGDKLSNSPEQNSLEMSNTEACVEYQSDNTSPSPSLSRLDDKSNSSSLKLDSVDDKSKVPNVDHNVETSPLSNSPLAKSDNGSPSMLSYTDKLDYKAQHLLTKPNLDGTTEENSPISQLETVEPTVQENLHTPTLKPEISETKTSPDIDAESQKHCDENVPQTELPIETKTDGPISLPLSETSLPESIDFGLNENDKTTDVVEAINQNLEPPLRPKRRQKSPKPPKRYIKPKPPPEEYPDDLNPFEDEDDEPSAAGTNPFGSDSDDEDYYRNTPSTSTPITSPLKTPVRVTPSASPIAGRRLSDFSPIRKAPSLNPFEDSDDELEEDVPAKPVPLPRKTAPSPEPSPFPRSALRASQRSIASSISTSSRKKRPAPPPPTPPSPTSTIRSIRSRKTRRAPLPPGIASSRLSLASDTISIGGDSYSVANEAVDFPEQISAVADRISEWVETSQLEINHTGDATADDSALAHNLSGSISDKNPSSPIRIAPESLTELKPKNHPVPAIEIDDADKPSEMSSLDDDLENSKNKCHIEVPKSIETIPQIASTSPVKTRDPSPSDRMLDNKNDLVIKSDTADEINDFNKMHHEKITYEEENIKESTGKRLSDLVMNDVSITEIDKFKTDATISSKKSYSPPRPLEPEISINRKSYGDSDVEDRLFADKKNKDDLNMTRKISGSSTESSSGGYNLHKSTHGQWRRKKAPAPPLPLNPDRIVKKKDLPLLKIKQELNDIEIKQQGLERQGVALEAQIRDKFDSDASITPYVEELVLQLFELVNEKNELFRKQAELMYLRRQQHLEEEQAELEREIRALMGRPEANKTDSDKELEEQLIQRLVEVVERRDAIVQCLEMDRIREAEEDRSISAQLNVFTKAMAPDDKFSTSPKKKKAGTDNTKKKWYTLSRSPKKSHS